MLFSIVNMLCRSRLCSVFLSRSFLFSLHYNSQCFYHFYIEHIYNLPCAFLCGPISDFSTFHCFLRCSEFNYSFDRNDLNWMSTSFRIFDSFPIRHFHLLLLLWFFLYISLFVFSNNFSTMYCVTWKHHIIP